MTVWLMIGLVFLCAGLEAHGRKKDRKSVV